MGVEGSFPEVVTRGRLVIIMPFGVLDVEGRGEPHDFDAFYAEVLRPIAQDEGWEVLRADEVTEASTVTSEVLRELYAADLVVADVSRVSGNVYYELGVRQAVSPEATVLVALSGTQLPVAISSHRVLFYGEELPSDTGFRDSYRAALGASPRAEALSPARQALDNLGLAGLLPT